MEKEAESSEAKKEGVEKEEDVDDELANPNLYEESMAEITFNETRDGGHDTDPFDRSGEYDDDVDLAAPPPITPDIPDVPPPLPADVQKRKESERNEKKLKEERL